MVLKGCLCNSCGPEAKAISSSVIVNNLIKASEGLEDKLSHFFYPFCNFSKVKLKALLAKF